MALMERTSYSYFKDSVSTNNARPMHRLICSTLTLIFTLFLSTKVEAKCYFPGELQGVWATQAAPNVPNAPIAYTMVTIDANEISTWGQCYSKINENIILADRSGPNSAPCFRCFLLVVASVNVAALVSGGLETCHSSVENALTTCPKTERGADHIVLYKVRSSWGEAGLQETQCPFSGIHLFSYEKGERSYRGGRSMRCEQPTSELSNCPFGFSLSLQYRDCTFTDPRAANWHCLGSWKGLDGQKYTTFLDMYAKEGDGKPKYKCGIYKKDARKGIVYLAMSRDSTCTNDLLSAKDGHERYVLHNAPPSPLPENLREKTCSFPNGLRGQWHNLYIGRSSIKYRDENQFNTLHLQCVQEFGDAERYAVYSRSDCGKWFYTCILLRRRSANVMEVMFGTSRSQSMDPHLCDIQQFKNMSTWITRARTFLESPTSCPIVGTYRGELPDSPEYCAHLFSDCTKTDLMYYAVDECTNSNAIFERDPKSIPSESSTRGLISRERNRPVDIPPRDLTISDNRHSSSLPYNRRRGYNPGDNVPREISVSSDQFGPSMRTGGMSRPSMRPQHQRPRPSDGHHYISGHRDPSIYNDFVNRDPMRGEQRLSQPPPSTGYRGSPVYNGFTGIDGVAISVSKKRRKRESVQESIYRIHNPKTTTISFVWGNPNTITTTTSLPLITTSKHHGQTGTMRDKTTRFLGHRRDHSASINHEQSRRIPDTGRTDFSSVRQPERSSWRPAFDDQIGQHRENPNERHFIPHNRQDTVDQFRDFSGRRFDSIPTNQPSRNIPERDDPPFYSSSRSVPGYLDRPIEPIKPSIRDDTLGFWPSNTVETTKVEPNRFHQSTERNNYRPTTTRERPERPRVSYSDNGWRNPSFVSNPSSSSWKSHPTPPSSPHYHSPSIKDITPVSTPYPVRSKNENDWNTLSKDRRKPVSEEREYQCIGEWEENGRVYALTRRKDIHTYECFVGVRNTQEGVVYIKEAGSSCSRDIKPQDFGMKTIIKEECVKASSRSRVNKMEEERSDNHRGSRWSSHPRVTSISPPPWVPSTTRPWKPITGRPRRRKASSSGLVQMNAILLLISMSSCALQQALPYV